MSDGHDFSPNTPEEGTRAFDFSKVVKPLNGPVRNPISEFELEHAALMVSVLNNATDERILRSVLLALTSVTEAYFRAILANCVRVCPIADEKVATKGGLSISAARYYSKERLVLGLLENVSLSDSDAIKKWTRDLLILEIPADSEKESLAAAMAEFDRLCGLRHAAVHSWGVLNTLNCAQAKVAAGHISELSLNAENVQSLGLVCLNVVRAYNRWLFARVTDRMFDRKMFAQIYEKDSQGFNRLLEVFLSQAFGKPLLRTIYMQVLTSYKKRIAVRAEKKLA